MREAVALVSLAAGLIAAGCGSTNPVEPEAQPVVNTLRTAIVPTQYQYTYIPASPSPFLACFDGIDRVEVAVNWENGVVRLQPRRDAPAVWVTQDLLLVEGSSRAAVWSPDLSVESISDQFGVTMATFIETGTRSPDPNATINALVEIALSVRLVPTVQGLTGATIAIELDQSKFNEESTNEVEGPPPAVTATIDENGLVAGYLVSDIPAAGEPDPDTNYAVVIDYTPSTELQVPMVDDDRLPINEIQYPSAASSCFFES